MNDSIQHHVDNIKPKVSILTVMVISLNVK